MELNVKDISGKWLSVENESARLFLLQGGYVTEGTAVYQQDNGNIYVYNGEGWYVLPNEKDKVDTAYSKVLNHDSFLSSMLRITDRLDQVEKSLGGVEIMTETITPSSGTIKTDILPDHVASKFCRKLKLAYSGELASGTSAESVKINNKAVTFTDDIELESGQHSVRFEVFETTKTSNALIIKKTFDAGTENEVSVETELSDSFVLTIEVTTATDANTSVLDYELNQMAYADVDLDYPYPVLELRDGSVVYRTNLSGVAASEAADRLGFLFDIYACYNLGNTVTYINSPLITKTKNNDAGYKGCEYCE